MNPLFTSLVTAISASCTSSPSICWPVARDQLEGRGGLARVVNRESHLQIPLPEFRQQSPHFFFRIGIIATAGGPSPVGQYIDPFLDID